VDERIDKSAAPLLAGPNRLRLAVFGANERRGLVMTTADGPPEATWPESVRIARKTEEVGIEALIPLARWLGYGGPNDPGSRSFETFTWAAGLAAATTRLQVFATFHVPVVHPVMAAKMIATIDHISGGRFGLNIVAGWQREELAMFGAGEREHDQRYEAAEEWATVLERLWQSDEPFDFAGEVYDVPGAYSDPKPIQRPGPVVMSAGISPAGRRFAARHADMIFAAPVTAESVAEIKALGRELGGRELLVFGRAHVTCAENEKDAQAAYDNVIRTHGDYDAARNVLRMLTAESQSPDFESEGAKQMLEAIVRGYFADPVTGTPEQVADRFAELADLGLDGIAITWNDYDEGLRQYEEWLLPLLIERGLRTPVSPA
jgi:alkanesulfonate monooxygenase SsuD/methylene tetrahydromethanopterin reductase-like flavin-dependent oxidoreductase (luciferase family)